MKYIKFLVAACCIIACGSEFVQGQTPSTSAKFILKNGAGNTVTLALPGSGVTNYTLTFPAVAGGSGSVLFANNGTGTLGWVTPGGIGQVLSINSLGIPVWTTPLLGTVSSIGLSMPTGFTVSNSPITTSGTLTVTTTLNGPIRGNGTGFITGNINLASEVSGTLGITHGGTGQTTYATGDILFASAVNTLSKLPAGTNGNVLTISGGIQIWAAANSGTITSVGLLMPSALYSSVSNSPITSSGTMIPQLATQTANTVFAGPTSGAATTPTFRGLVAADIPSGSGNYIQNGTILQTADFNISGNGTIDGQLQLKGTSTGNSTFQAGSQGGTDINYTLPISQGSAGTVLQNDGTGTLSWADQSTQIGAVKFEIKGSDETVTNSSTLQNDNDLSFTIGANEIWELFVQLDAINDGNDDDNSSKLKVAVTIPSGTLHVYAYVVDNEGDGDDGSWLTTSGTANSSAFELNGSDDKGPVQLQGLIVGGSTSGTVHIQWAPDSSSNSKVTVKKNSYMKVTKAK